MGPARRTPPPAQRPRKTLHRGGVAITQAFYRPQQPPLRYSKQFLHPDERPFFVPGLGVRRLEFAAGSFAFAICYEISVPDHTPMIPTLQTERLILDGFTLADGPAVERLAGHPAVAATTASIPHPYPPGAAQAWIETHMQNFECDRGVSFAVRLRESRDLIGCVGLVLDPPHQRGELGYWLAVDHWNRGYATEAARACVAFGFNHFHLLRITSRHFATNPASGRVMQKLGMTHEGCLRLHHKKGDRFHDLVLYGLLRQEFQFADPPPTSLPPAR